MDTLITGLHTSARTALKTGLVVVLVKLQLQNLLTRNWSILRTGPEKPGNPHLESVTTRLEIISMQLYTLATKSLVRG